MTDDKLAWLESQSKSQIAAVVQSLEIQLKNLSRAINLGLVDLAKDSKTEYGSDSLLGDFQMVGKLSLNGKEFSLGDKYFLEKTSIKAWAESYVTLALKMIKPGDIPNNSVAIYSLLDPQRRPYFFTIHHLDDKNWFIGVLSSQIFQSLMDRQKGQASTVYVVNQLGQALGHTTSEYVGSLLTEEPLVAELMKEPALSGSKVYNGLSGDKVQGVYEQVANSNVYAVVLNPMSRVNKFKMNLIYQIGLIALGVGLIGIALIFIFYKPEMAPASSLPAVVNDSLRPNSSKGISLIPIASALANEIKGPIVSILAHVRLIKLEPKNAALHTESIEKEAQVVRELIQKLTIFAGEDSENVIDVNISQMIERTVKALEPKLSVKGVHIDKNLSTILSATTLLQPVHMAKAIQNIINNSVEAMERTASKNLTISAKMESPNYVIEISDSGEGISTENIEKIFDPFFTTKSFAGNTGLGLSFAMGVVRQAKGDIKVESQVGIGTQIKIYLPINAIEAPRVRADIDGAEKTVVINPPLQIANHDFIAPRAPTAAVVDESHGDEESVAAPEANSHPLFDDAIEKMIDEDIESPALPPAEVEEARIEIKEDPLANKRISEELAKEFPPMPVEKDEEVLPPAAEPKPQTQTSLRIDAPDFEVPKSPSKLDQVEVKIRKPGFKGSNA